MNRFAEVSRRYPADHEVVLPEGYGLWCRIEELAGECGYNPHTQFALLRELPDAYPVLPGTDPEEIAEEHPMQALAALVRRYLAEYPQEAAKRTVVRRAYRRAA